MTTTAAPVSAILKSRIAHLIRAQGFTKERVSAALGQSHGWLRAKFAPPDAKWGRPMTLGDIDAILGAIGLDATAILNPAKPPAITDPE